MDDFVAGFVSYMIGIGVGILIGWAIWNQSPTHKQPLSYRANHACKAQFRMVDVTFEGKLAIVTCQIPTNLDSQYEVAVER